MVTLLTGRQVSVDGVDGTGVEDILGNGHKVIEGWAVFVGDRRVVFVNFNVNHLEVCSMAPSCGVDIMDTMHYLLARGIEWEYGTEEFVEGGRCQQGTIS